MDRVVLPRGTVIALDHGLPIEVRDRAGAVHAVVEWDGGRLVAMIVPVRPAVGAMGDAIILTGDRVPHPVLGASHRILRSRDPEAPSEHVATCAAVTWAHPDRIPAIDQPGALPAGTGTAIMNLLAWLTSHAGLPALRYAGPYPTMALWSTLSECFRPVGDPIAARERFLHDAEGHALRAETITIDVDLAPASFERVVVAPGVWVQLREGLERASIAERSYARGGLVRRLVEADGGTAAEIWLGDARWHRVAEFAADGALIDGPHPRPPVASAIIGQPFPPPLVEALAELCSDGEPAMLAPAMRDALTATPIRWGDAGDDAAIVDGRSIVVHAVVWDRLAPRGMATLAAALADALTPIARRLGQAQLARMAP